jgi:hypothetical protein
MDEQEALGWLKQVGGAAFRRKGKPKASTAWVAVVRTPPAGGRSGRIILAFGESLERATHAAEKEWEKQWATLSNLH